MATSEPWAGSISPKLCEHVTCFILECFRYRQMIEVRLGQSHVLLLDNTKAYWEKYRTVIEQRWLFVINDYKQPITNKYVQTSLSEKEINPKTQLYFNADPSLFQKDWVHFVDLLVAYVELLRLSQDWLIRFVFNWKCNREEIFELWRSPSSRAETLSTKGEQLKHEDVRQRSSLNISIGGQNQPPMKSIDETQARVVIAHHIGQVMDNNRMIAGQPTLTKSASQLPYQPEKYGPSCQSPHRVPMHYANVRSSSRSYEGSREQDQVARLQEEIEGLKRHNRELISSNETANFARRDDLKRFQDIMKQMETQNVTFQNDYTRLCQHISELNMSLGVSHDENGMLKYQVSSIIEQKNETERKLKSVEEEHNSLISIQQQEKEELQQTMVLLENELSWMKTKQGDRQKILSQSLEQKKITIQLLQQDLTTEQNEKTKLREELKMTNEKYKSTKIDLQKMREKNMAENQHEETKLQLSEDHEERNLATMKSMADRLESTKEQLQSLQHTVARQLSDIDEKALRINLLESKLQQQSEELESCNPAKDAIQGVQTDSPMSDGSSARDTNRLDQIQLVEDLKLKDIEIERLRRELSNAIKEIYSKTTEISKVSDDNQHTKSSLLDTNKELMKLKDTYAIMNRTQRESCTSYNAELDENRMHEKKESSSVEYLQKTLQKKEDELQASRRDYNGIKEEMQTLKRNASVTRSDLFKAQDEITTLQRRLEEATNENAWLKKEVGSYKQNVSTYEQRIQNLKLESTAANTTIKNIRLEISQMKQQVTLSTEVQRHLQVQLQKRDEVIRQMKEEKNMLMDQLSSKMNNELSRDETDLENINVKNRPMKILEEFEQFCSQQWLDAKTALDDSAEEARPSEPLHESERCRLLCQVLVEAYSQTKTMFDRLHNNISREAYRVSIDPESINTYENLGVISGAHSSAHKELELSLAKVFKQQSDKAKFEKSVKPLIETVFKKEVNNGTLRPAIQDAPEVLEYIRYSLSLCWRMVLQQPPMTLDCQSLVGKPFADDKSEPHFGSSDPSNHLSVVHYYVYPAVFHGASQMKKARVFLAQPKCY